MTLAGETFRSVATVSSGCSRSTIDARKGLRATSERRGTALVVWAGGEVDASNEQAWTTLLNTMACAITTPGPLVVDISALQFVSASAFRALAHRAQRCRERGLTLAVVSTQPIVAHIVAATGLSPLLPVHVSVEAALSCAPSPRRKHHRRPQHKSPTAR